MDITYYKKYEPIFGEWHIVREIGEGSFGKVFEIEREDFGYTYKAALKAITIPQSQSELDGILASGMDMGSATEYCQGIVKELNEEFHLMSKLKGNSNVVSYEDHVVIEHSDGIGWDVLIRMELLTPLMRYIRNNPLNRDSVVRLGIDICKALELCRKHDIVHRDIKPDNIFVSDDGRFKLGDFGIAKTMEHTTGSIGKKGTYNYMAPEVYKGEPYGSRVDIYSLGIMLYRYMNGGRLPFHPLAPTPLKSSDNERAISRRISGEPMPAPINADAELAKVILKACAYRPEDRFMSPTEMREALKAIAGLEIEGNDDKTVSIFNPEISVPHVPKASASEVLTKEEPTKIDPYVPSNYKYPHGEDPAPPLPEKSIKSKNKIAFIFAALIIALFVVVIVLHTISAKDQQEYGRHENSFVFTKTSVSDTDEGNNDQAAVPTVIAANIAGVSASSYLVESEYNFYHLPENLIDGSLEKAWVEAADGVGIGETITIHLNSTCKVSGFIINAGYQKNESIYAKNSRPASLKVTFSDGKSQIVKLDDVLGPQTITFDTAVETSSLSFTIESVFAGTEYMDTAISEIRLF
ncbi:MAG: protein kinase [Bacillota bacterium]|nr:protein kinase [Bacillota bacterium]